LNFGWVGEFLKILSAVDSVRPGDTLTMLQAVEQQCTYIALQDGFWRGKEGRRWQIKIYSNLVASRATCGCILLSQPPPPPLPPLPGIDPTVEAKK
jgi:hypothetical protein